MAGKEELGPDPDPDWEKLEAQFEGLQPTKAKAGDPEPLPDSVAANVRIARKVRHWTQEQLAVRAHVTRETVRGVENATNDVRLSTIAKLANALHVDPYRLLRRDGPFDEAATPEYFSGEVTASPDRVVVPFHWPPRFTSPRRVCIARSG
jgi:transcriptional regulator with XRE-family HTH domain